MEKQDARTRPMPSWLDNCYPVIAERAKAEGVEIHWGNETGLRTDDLPGRSFSPRRCGPRLKIFGVASQTVDRL
jgi:hypothetical protein